MSKTTIKREDYVRHLVKQAGLTYVQAEAAYSATMRLFEDAIAEKNSIILGRFGVLEPKELKPRRVSMGFKKVGGRTIRCRREFFLGVRTRYVFRVFRAFGSAHDLVP